MISLNLRTQRNAGKGNADLQRGLDLLSGWCDKNKLTINTKKTKCMLFGLSNMVKKTVPPLLNLKGDILQYVKFYKYLGIILDPSLTFNKHATEMMNNAAFRIHQLAKIRYYINFRTAVTIYNSMVAPYLDYGDIFYISCHQQTVDQIQKMQNRGLRVCK